MTAPTSLPWWRSGERFFAAALDQVGEEALDAPSLLPDWSRRRLVAHMARNADALVNLLTWARTGEETPMYASPEARDAGITATAQLPGAALLADCRAASDRLLAAAEALPEEAWDHQVRTAQGRVVPASEVAWMRCREVWVHAVDLDSGLGFADVPDDVLVALVDDVHRTWERKGLTPDLAFASDGHAWGQGGTTVSGSLPDVTAWVTGRPSAARTAPPDAAQALPAWL